MYCYYIRVWYVSCNNNNESKKININKQALTPINTVQEGEMLQQIWLVRLLPLTTINCLNQAVLFNYYFWTRYTFRYDSLILPKKIVIDDSNDNNNNNGMSFERTSLQHFDTYPCQQSNSLISWSVTSKETVDYYVLLDHCVDNIFIDCSCRAPKWAIHHRQHLHLLLPDRVWDNKHANEEGEEDDRNNTSRHRRKKKIVIKRRKCRVVGLYILILYFHN